MATIPLFNGFYNGLYQFKQPVSKVWYGNFCGVDGPQYNFYINYHAFIKSNLDIYATYIDDFAYIFR